jgi:hypothetical protein
MYKKIGACLILAVVSSVARGDISIDFRNNPSPTTQSIFTDATLVTRAPIGTWCVQLIWSSDNTADMFTDVLNPLTSLASGEVQLARLFPDASAGRILSTDYTDQGFATASTTQTYAQNGGYVYARFFNSTTPTVGSSYYELPISGLMAASPSVNQVYYSNSYFDTPIVAVPEPGTYGLLIVGIGLIALRKRLVS